MASRPPSGCIPTHWHSQARFGQRSADQIRSAAGCRQFHFDEDGVVITALQLSRLVRDNGYSMEYAARIVDYEDSQKQVIPQGQHYLAFLPNLSPARGSGLAHGRRGRRASRVA